jgi:hypothetical protein
MPDLNRTCPRRVLQRPDGATVTTGRSRWNTIERVRSSAGATGERGAVVLPWGDARANSGSPAENNANDICNQVADPIGAASTRGESWNRIELHI